MPQQQHSASAAAAAAAAIAAAAPVTLFRYVFQGVHMLMQMTCTSQGDVMPWGPSERRVNRIVFIGRNLDREALTKGFEACLVGLPAGPPAGGAVAEGAVQQAAEVVCADSSVKVQA
jgi:hypothetical protein